MNTMHLLRRIIAVAGTLLAIVGLSLSASQFGQAQETNRLARSAEGNGTPVAVVELFTSEGCSSCPPADEVLRGLSGEHVIPLSFHVDYWNRLGWRDPFSDAAYSERQRRYARVFEGGRVYTPQAVVNGRFGLVGSRRRALDARIRETSAMTSASVSLAVERHGQNLSLRYSAHGASARAQLHIALVESNLETRVRRGENRGRTLRHDHVVRVLRTAEGSESTLVIPPDVRAAHAALVAFVQHPDTMVIEGATRVAVPQS